MMISLMTMTAMMVMISLVTMVVMMTMMLIRCKTMPTPPRNGMVVVPQVISHHHYHDYRDLDGFSQHHRDQHHHFRQVMERWGCSSARMATPSMEPIRQNAFTVRITSMPIMVILVVIYQTLPEAQRTQGIESITQIITPGKKYFRGEMKYTKTRLGV